MVNKIIKAMAGLILVLLLTGCKIPEEQKPFDPSLVEVDINHVGNLLQRDDNVSEVIFTTTHNQTHYIPTKIIWNRNLFDVFEGDTFKLTPTEGLISKIDVFATIVFEENDEVYQFTTSIKTINIVGQTADIEIKSSLLTQDETIIENTLTIDSKPLKIEAVVTGDYGPEDLTWWVIDESNLLEVEYDEFRGMNTFEFKPSEVGVLRVEARINGNKFVSNKIYVNSTYGKLLLSQGNNNNGVVNITSSFNAELEGSYRWEVLTQDGIDYVLIPAENSSSLTVDLSNETKSALYRAAFITTNDDLEIISEPILITNNSYEVRSETELLTALGNKVKVIELKSDILYTKIDGPQNNPIIINYPVTIIGNNHRLSSLGIFMFIRVESNNVWFQNLKIDNSSRYNVMVVSSSGGYFEDVEFIKPGGGSDMLTPGAGIYAYGSDITVKNITITEAFNSGLRIEATYSNGNLVNKANITILGKFNYNASELFAPIVSVSSTSTDAKVSAVGFDEFIIPIGSGRMIRRWSNDAYGVKWELKAPYVVDYQPGEPINFRGIVINVRIGAGESTDFGLEFVYLFLDIFKETGTIRISKPGEIATPISEYTIYAYDREIGGDFLLYQDDNGQAITPDLPEEPGDYQVHIWVGDTIEGDGLYLGYIMVRVNPTTT